MRYNNKYIPTCIENHHFVDCSCFFGHITAMSLFEVAIVRNYADVFGMNRFQESAGACRCGGVENTESLIEGNPEPIIASV